MNVSLSVPSDDALMDRVKDVAHQITNRVRTTLRPPRAGPPARRPIRVLCVDDDPDVADSMADLLELLGCEARACYSGPAALDAFTAFDPDACFFDLNLAGMDGLCLAERLRRRAAGRPPVLVALTAFGSVEDRIRTALGGFHYHLVKPVDGATLADLVNRLSELLHHARR